MRLTQHAVITLLLRVDCISLYISKLSLVSFDFECRRTIGEGNGMLLCRSCRCRTGIQHCGCFQRTRTRSSLCSETVKTANVFLIDALYAVTFRPHAWQPILGRNWLHQGVCTREIRLGFAKRLNNGKGENKKRFGPSPMPQMRSCDHLKSPEFVLN